MSLTSAPSDPQPGIARISFGPYNDSSGKAGTADFDISPIIVGAAFPIAEIDLWLDMLNGDRKVYFVYICHGEASADGDTDIVLMSLTTEDVPGGDHHLATASSIQALYPDFH